jgi:hypothetical protein
MRRRGNGLRGSTLSGFSHSLHPVLRIPRALLLADVHNPPDVVGVVRADVRNL